jgi:hypothetical protein
MILEILIIFSILGMCSAFISYFIDFCFGEGNIFEKYYLFLLTYVEPKSKWLFKILGGCNICLNFWVSLFIFIIYFFVINVKPIYFIPYIGFSVITSLYLNLKAKLL